MKKVFIFFSVVTLSASIGFVFNNCADLESSHSGPGDAFKSPLDVELDAIIRANNLVPIEAEPAEPADLVALGKELFNDKVMSGKKDVSCATCHVDRLGSGDGLPFSIGAGAEGEFPNRKQIDGLSIPMRRHSMTLFNKGRSNQFHALWDGRLQIQNGIPSTPVADISGPNPNRGDITREFQNAFDIQPLFPIISVDEFLGTDNELSALGNEVSIWNRVLNQRLLSQSTYVELFRKAFPSVSRDQLNPGHLSRAIRSFVKTRFVANDTPFDRYISGDIQALTETQKKGMKLFYTKAACSTCHSGTFFTNNQFESAGTPQLGFVPFLDDLGREEATGETRDRYKFKVPGLRNVKISAPYMHNGAFDSLKSVVEHYNNVRESLDNYSIPSDYQNHYDQQLIVDRDPARNNIRRQQILDPRIRNGINLEPEELNDLLEFLAHGLLDISFQSR